MNDIESKVLRRAAALGFAIGWRQVENGRTRRTLLDPQNPTAVFAEADDFWPLLGLLWRLPNIAGRSPRPSVSDLVHEVAELRGYKVLVQPSNANEQISFTDQDGKRVGAAPHWMRALNVVVRLTPIVRMSPPSNSAQSVMPSTHLPDTGTPRDNSYREAQSDESKRPRGSRRRRAAQAPSADRAEAPEND